MVNIKPAKKGVLTSTKRAEGSKVVRFATKTAARKVGVTVVAGDKVTAEENFRKAERVLTMAASKGILHENTSSRRMPRLLKSIAVAG